MDDEYTMAVEPTVAEETQAQNDPTPEEVTPEVTPSAEPETTSVEDLYELPDGRKVDAQTLSKEWKENFYPEFTRRSQELSSLKGGKKDEQLPNNPQEDEFYKDPLWEPQSYAEIIEAAKVALERDQIAKENARIERENALETAVSTQLSEVKAIDPTVDENQLFKHAIKFKFSDLRVAHENMREMNEIAKRAKQETAENIKKRNDPVSMGTGAGNPVNVAPTSFASARDYLRSLK